MEIRVLRYFIAVAREKNVTKAAEYLHVTQPTLSRQLHELESELGTVLFKRVSHGVELTEGGIRLRDRTRAILSLVDKTETEFKTSEKGITGTVYLGGAETDLIRTIARVAKRVKDDNPGVMFELHSGNEEDIAAKLDRGLLDFAVFMEPADLSKYRHLALPGTDIWGLLMRKDNPLALKVSVTIEDLKTVPLMVSRQASSRSLSSNIFTDWFGDDLDAMNVVGTFDLLGNTVRFVEEGMCCAFSVERLIGLDPDRNLCFRPMEPPLAPISSIAWKRDGVFSPAAAAFMDELKRQLT